MASPKINPMGQIKPMIYAYTTPEIKRHDGWTKIGYTEAQSVEDRIKQQCHTVNVEWKLGWKQPAMYTDGSYEYFRDEQFHYYLTNKCGIEQQDDVDNEWFHIEPAPAKVHFDNFASRDYNAEQSDEQFEYMLRDEQNDAVNKTLAYFDEGGEEFLWNAKPRFGKTLSAYDLVRRMAQDSDKPIMVLVVTNRPSIANSWADDFYKFIGWRGEIAFVSENEAVAGRSGVLSRDEYLKLRTSQKTKDGDSKIGMVAFESLQNLKGGLEFGGKYDKLKWIKAIEFDLLIVDESQEGVDTFKTEQAFDNIRRKHTLYLSGTPFKALADGRFNDIQIFNWSYVDEQRAKQEYSGDAFNPYERLPELQMFTYQMSPMIEGELRRGAAIGEDGETVDYAFDLNEFFSVKDATSENPTFKHKDSVEKFLNSLSTNEKYPFSTPELRAELPHTLWLLDRVASAKALSKMLKDHPVFSEYKIVLAAGDGRVEEDDEIKRSYDKVKDAIANNEKTITLSVGQLTVGVTVPEWSGVLMLSNMKSSTAYMQAAFRVQNPYEATIIRDGKQMRVRKENAYVFDFDPARTLIIFEEFANNLSTKTAGGAGTADDRKRNIKELLNFFPVIGEDDAGKMVEIDAQAVLSIPRRLKSIEVVRRGFMSNYLFQNIGLVFAAPAAVTEIVAKLTPAKKDSFDARAVKASMESVPTDANGEISIPNEVVIGKTQEVFGPKIYESLADSVEPIVEGLCEDAEPDDVVEKVMAVGEALKQTIENDVIKPAFEQYDLKKGKVKQLVKEVNNQIEHDINKVKADYEQQVRIINHEYNNKVEAAETSEQIEAADSAKNQALMDALSALSDSVKEVSNEIITKQPQETTQKLETFKAQEEKKTVEDKVRDYLRGFSRTIPSFIMAYGDEKLTLGNFDDYTEDDVFEEVTGITEEDFRFLRDGGEYIDETTGKTEYFAGGIFDETVFNDSIQEFLNKRDELANYFDESHTEDIFDYIPPQKSPRPQIFTPRWIVRKMVEELEVENPGCFDNPNATFADLYMKSGMYITEIVKRLYNSVGLRDAYPDDAERLSHIFSKQVYGIAALRITYLIAINYIFGFDPQMKTQALSDDLPNFAQADVDAAAKEGRLPELVDECFGGAL